MSRLSEYESLQGKNIYFETENRIETKQDFNDLWRELTRLYRSKEYLFRGVDEAKYKLYTSSQRFWVTQELNKQNNRYHEFIKRLIAESRQWNRSTISKLLEANGIRNDVFAYLSYMQHFRVPTPLLDFSYNPFVALFFAVDSLQAYPSDREIDNYCSLYVTNSSNEYFQDMKNALEISLKGGFLKEEDFYDRMSTHPTQLIETDNPIFKVLNNTNIINQEGLFFYNNHPVYPIEEIYYQNIQEVQQYLDEYEFKESKYAPHFARCINIHKGLKEYILTKLATKGIDSEYIYPNIEKLAGYAVTKALAFDDTTFELEEAREHVKRAHIQEAIDTVIEYTTRNEVIQLDEATSLSGRFKQLRTQRRKGIIEQEAYDVEWSRIVSALLDVINELMKSE